MTPDRPPYNYALLAMKYIRQYQQSRDLDQFMRRMTRMGLDYFDLRAEKKKFNDPSNF